MRFLKKAKGLVEKQQAVNERLETIRRQVQNKEKAIAEAKSNLANVLGNLALENSEANTEAVKRAKKVLSMQMNGLDDLQTMVVALGTEQKNLAKEALEACTREAPEKAAAACTTYNALLQQAVETLAVLRKYHAELLQQQTAYNNILRERTAALQTLGVVEGLDMQVGMGELALVPTPHRYVMTTPDAGLDRFIMELIGYERKLLDYLQFAKANPDHGNIQDVSQDRAGIGEIGPPNRTKEFMSVHEPGQPSQQ